MSEHPAGAQPAPRAAAGGHARSEQADAYRRRWENQPFNRFLGLELAEQQDGYCRVLLHPTEQTPRGAGNGLHGGVLASLVDIAALGAIASAVGPNDIMSGTAELNISYLRPALGDLVVTEARVLKKGRALVAVDVDISDGQGRLFSKGRVQYALRQQGG
jgi:uncharacterized protein (TIGR00369 family)